MIDARELRWGRAGQDGGRLTAVVRAGACAALSGPPADTDALLLVIAGVHAPASGQLLFEGRDVTTDPLTRRRQACCTMLVPALAGATVADILTLAGAGRGRPSGAGALLRLAGLPPGARADRLNEPDWDTLAVAAGVASGAPLLLVKAPFASGSRDDHARRRALLGEARHDGRTLVITGLDPRDPLADATIEVAG